MQDATSAFQSTELMYRSQGVLFERLEERICANNDLHNDLFRVLPRFGDCEQRFG